jgi:hypothetical protein
LMAVAVGSCFVGVIAFILIPDDYGLMWYDIVVVVVVEGCCEVWVEIWGKCSTEITLCTAYSDRGRARTRSFFPELPWRRMVLLIVRWNFLWPLVGNSNYPGWCTLPAPVRVGVACALRRTWLSFAMRRMPMRPWPPDGWCFFLWWSPLLYLFPLRCVGMNLLVTLGSGSSSPWFTLFPRQYSLGDMSVVAFALLFSNLRSRGSHSA